MPRIARLVIPGVPYHITGRGNNRADIFCTDADRLCYLELLKQYAGGAELEVLGYCLMSNHIHLIGIPHQPESLARGVGLAQLRYAQLFNRHTGHSGHLWQGRYFACPLDEAHLVVAMCYVERNPVRAELVRSAAAYRWSSARAHLGQQDQTGMLSLELWQQHWPAAAWRKMLRRPAAAGELQALRCQTRVGRPLGSDTFIASLEAKLGIALRPRKAGRKKQGPPAKRK